RLIFQFIILGFIGYVAVRPLFDSAYVADFESYCPFGGLASLGSKINQGSMSCQMSEVQLLMGIGLIVGVIIIGKLFCSYICPIGTVSEWLGRIGDKLKVRINMPRLIDRPMRALKYVLLFTTLYLTMTTSELFCKEYDPYFASVNLLGNADINQLFAITALAIAILGSIFFRLFWCKYLCPLGAVSNIFLNIIPAAAIILLFVVINALGAELNFVWLIGALVLLGLITELGFMRSFLMPYPKITRNVDKCSDCGICETECPQGIKISEYKEVTHIDCNLCTDCVYSCPLKNTLTVGKKKHFKYLAPVAVTLLILLSLGASTQVEFNTISERWDNFDSNKDYAVYEQTGLKNVKCYGSAMSLKTTLDKIEGIHGLDAYASSHTVVIYYDPKIIAEKKVKESLFTSTKIQVHIPKPGTIDSIAEWQVGIYGLFDVYDFNNLFYALQANASVYGFETRYGEPVLTSVFYDASKTNVDEMIAQIEREVITAKKPTGNEEIEIEFDVDGKGTVKDYLTLSQYRQHIFRTYDREFNDYQDYKLEELTVLSFTMPEAGAPPMRRFFSSLTSHLSADSGIVRMSTRWAEKPTAYIFFVKEYTNIEKIKAALIKPMLTVFISDTETRDIKNPFKINPDGGVTNAVDIKIDNELDN
ncbi:MAG: 4Fe-4S binding protein, partial [Ignavibacteriaceae bacterium]|nr:4Fe-4S binding protein [Ignavibacteriaceae bacterium]